MPHMYLLLNILKKSIPDLSLLGNITEGLSISVKKTNKRLRRNKSDQRWWSSPHVAMNRAIIVMSKVLAM